MAYYYNKQVENSILNIYSLILEIYYEAMNLSTNYISNHLQQQIILNQYSNLFKENLYNFSNYYAKFNIEVGNQYNLIFKNRKFYKIEGFWEEEEFNSTVGTELHLILYYLYSINTTILYSGNINNELKNFCFFSNKSSSHIRLETSFIKILYYLCVNYDYTYKDIFCEMKNSIFLSFN